MLLCFVGVTGFTGFTGVTGPTGPNALGPLAPVDLLFTFRTIQDTAPGATGTWQMFVIRPDFSQVFAPLVNIRDPPVTVGVVVPQPLYLGLYTATLYNVDMSGLTITQVIDGDMVVSAIGYPPAHTKLFTEGNSDITDGPGALLQDRVQGYQLPPPQPPG